MEVDDVLCRAEVSGGRRRKKQKKTIVEKDQGDQLKDFKEDKEKGLEVQLTEENRLSGHCSKGL